MDYNICNTTNTTQKNTIQIFELYHFVFLINRLHFEVNKYF